MMLSLSSKLLISIFQVLSSLHNRNQQALRETKEMDQANSESEHLLDRGIADAVYSNTALQYQLQQLDHNNQVFVSLHSENSTCFAIEYRSMIGAWRKKPDVTLKRLSVGKPPEIIGSIRFDRSLETLPWYPRASIQYNNEEQMIKMQDPLSLKWTVQISEIGCNWSLFYNPPSLVLKPVDSTLVLAVFMYGQNGNQARNGEVIGNLRIISGTAEEKDVAQILTSLAGIAAHWKGMGKILRCMQRY